MADKHNQSAHDALCELIDRIGTDEVFREALKIDGERAMIESGMAQRIESAVGDDEVTGFGFEHQNPGVGVPTTVPATIVAGTVWLMTKAVCPEPEPAPEKKDFSDPFASLSRW